MNQDIIKNSSLEALLMIQLFKERIRELERENKSLKIEIEDFKAEQERLEALSWGYDSNGN